MKNLVKFLLIVIGLNALVGMAARWSIGHNLTPVYATGWFAGFLCVIIAEATKNLIVKDIKK